MEIFKESFRKDTSTNITLLINKPPNQNAQQDYQKQIFVT